LSRVCFHAVLRCLPLIFVGAITACDAIEPERVRPQAKVPMPEIQTDPAYVDYLVEPYGGSWIPGVYPVVHMRVPKAPYYNHNARSGPYRVYNEYIMMFYPNFSGLADPENAECIDVKGFCRREMTVGFGIDAKGSRDDARQRKRLGEELARGYIRPVDRLSRYPELELVGENETVPETDSLRTTVYLSRETSVEPNIVIRCWELAPSPDCEAAFRASKSPHVYIKLRFVLALMPQWEDVIRDTRNKVDSMIIQTYELPEPEQKE
jgi:hypothetical protein